MFLDLGSPKIAENISFEELDKLLPSAEVNPSHGVNQAKHEIPSSYESKLVEEKPEAYNKLYPDLSLLTCDISDE